MGRRGGGVHKYICIIINIGLWFQPREDCPPSQHLREGGGRSQQYRNESAVSTIRGPFPPPPLLKQRPADTESSISPRRPADAPLHHQLHRYRHWPISIYYVLNCQMRALRKKHALFAHYGLFEWATSGVRLEWRTDWIDCERSLFTPCSWLRRRNVKSHRYPLLHRQ